MTILSQGYLSCLTMGGPSKSTWLSVSCTGTVFLGDAGTAKEFEHIFVSGVGRNSVQFQNGGVYQISFTDNDMGVEPFSVKIENKSLFIGNSILRRVLGGEQRTIEFRVEVDQWDVLRFPHKPLNLEFKKVL